MVPKAPDVQAKHIRVRSGKGHTVLPAPAKARNGS